MSTVVMLILSIEGEKVTPYVEVNPAYSSQTAGRAPGYSSTLEEGRKVNDIHAAVLKFAERYAE